MDKSRLESCVRWHGRGCGGQARAAASHRGSGNWRGVADRRVAGSPGSWKPWDAEDVERSAGVEPGRPSGGPRATPWNRQRSVEMTARVLQKWADCLVAAGREPAPDMVEEFERVLNDAVDERPLQRFLASAPVVLGPLVPPGGSYWCLDRPHLGSEFVPDFLLATATSAGFSWIAIELESPTVKALIKAGLPARKLADALGQIRDWRTWLTDNVAYARQERGLKDIDGSCEAVVLIGRRGSLDPRQIKKYDALSTDGITVMSYDRLHDSIRNSSNSGTIGNA